MSDISNNNENDPTITMYKNTIHRSEKDTEPLALYTTSQEEWLEYTEELRDVVITVALKYFLVGVVVGIFAGFFTFAKADPKVISQIKKHAPEKYQSTLLAIADIESTFRPAVVGDAKEYGLFQFHPKFFELKDKSIKGQVNEAVKHIKWLEKYCPADLAIAWNLGCTAAQKLKQPKKFNYRIKFALAKEKYEKKKSEDSRTASSGERKIANSSNTNKEI